MGQNRKGGGGGGGERRRGGEERGIAPSDTGIRL